MPALNVLNLWHEPCSSTLNIKGFVPMANKKDSASLNLRDEIGALFQPDVIVPAQYFADRSGKANLEPERRLMLAVLEDAIYCFQATRRARYGKSKRLFDATHEWFFGGGDSMFGFENICDVLDLNCDYIRAGLRRWREEGVTKEDRNAVSGRGKGSARNKVASAHAPSAA
jgi:hypothetical protein